MLPGFWGSGRPCLSGGCQLSVVIKLHRHNLIAGVLGNIVNPHFGWIIRDQTHRHALPPGPPADRGELYYEILTKQFIYRFNSTEKELLEELNIERSVFYDRKREAIYLFSVCLFGYSIPEVLEELPRLNPDKSPT